MKHRLYYVCLVLIGFCLPSSALIFYSTADPSYNTTAPTGTLANSGWQWQGEWSKGVSVAEYLGTPIAAHYFITAKHVAGTTSWDFNYNGKTYDVIQGYSDPSSDLQIWKVSEPFYAYAPLYTASDEDGKDCVVFGRGKIRGDQVEMTRTNGWKWGALDNTMRWGENQITDASGGYLISEFNGAGSNECATAEKDSGGAVFIQDNSGIWRLAGINYSVDPAQFSTNSTGEGAFYAACFDYRGLYTYNGVFWQLAGGPVKRQELSATRISERYAWITNVIGDELDVDVDLLPDWWESTYTNSVTGLVASVDIDLDGFTNLEEWYADTNPTVSNEAWVVSELITSTNQSFTFSSSTARQYQVSCTTNDLAYTGLVWFACSSPVLGTGSNTTLVVTNTEDKVFYRLEVSLP